MRQIESLSSIDGGCNDGQSQAGRAEKQKSRKAERWAALTVHHSADSLSSHSTPSDGLSGQVARAGALGADGRCSALLSSWPDTRLLTH
jgi:hypothetical protein